MKMSLHESKRVALLQWYNSISSYGLSDILQLSDGKIFCDTICSVSKISPSVETNPCPEVTNSTEVANRSCISSDISSIEEELKYIQSETVDSTNSVPKSDNITAVKNESVKFTESIETINYESERSSDSTRSYNPSFIVDLPCDVKAEPSAVLVTGDVDTKNSIVSNFDKHSVDVKERYEFIKYFINEHYNMQSEAIIAFDLCPAQNQLELGKVAVLILIKVVEHYIHFQNEVINTLFHLDPKVQEDIQQCMSFLGEQKTPSKRELVKILTKPAKYKSSPRKSPRVSITPTRNSARLRHSLTLTPSSEEVYTDSPLRSFLDSPQLKKVLVIKDKELQKAQQNLLLEEIKAEDFKVEINTLKKTLEEKDKEIMNLKKDLRELRAKDDEFVDCKACIDYKKQYELANQQLTQLKEENESKCMLQKEEIDTLSRKLRNLELKIKTEETKRVINAYDHLPEELLKKDKKLKELEEKNQSLSARNKQIQMELSHLIHSQAAVQYADEPDISKIEASLPDDKGECLGNVIEAENKDLRLRLNYVIQNVLDIFRRLGINEELAADMKQSLNISNNSNLLMAASGCQSAVQDFQLMPRDENLNVEEGTSSVIAEFEKDSEVNHTAFGFIRVENPAYLRKRKKSSLKSCENSVSSDLFPISAPEASSSNVVGSFWNQRFSSTLHKNYKERNNLCDVKIPTISKLRNELGLSAFEYSAKIEEIKKILISLKELFKSNGTNGRFLQYDYNFNLESDEDCLRCLLCIKKSVIQFQSKKALTLRNKCCDEAIETANKEIFDLKEETKLLKERLRSTEHLKLKLEQKENKIQELRKEISTLKSEVQGLSESNKNLSEQNKNLTEKYIGYDAKMDEIARKLKEREGIRRQFIALQAKKEENEEKFQKKVIEQKKQLIDYNNRCRSYFALYEKERDQKKEVCSQLENLKNEVLILRTQKRSAYKLLKEAKAKNQHYELHFTELKKKKEEPAPSAKPADKPNSQTVKSKAVGIEVQNPFNLRLEFTSGASAVPESAFSGNYSIPVEAENESITSHASRQNGSFLPCAADEPHCYPNHSAIADRDEDFILYNLKQRNTLQPAHLRQSFAYNCLKLVTSSPMVPPREIHEDNEEVLESRQKKRKINEVTAEPNRPATTDNAVTGPSGVTTPYSKSRKFKPPSSLKKLMMYRKNRPT